MLEFQLNTFDKTEVTKKALNFKLIAKRSLAVPLNFIEIVEENTCKINKLQSVNFGAQAHQTSSYPIIFHSHCITF